LSRIVEIKKRKTCCGVSEILAVSAKRATSGGSREDPLAVAFVVNLRIEGAGLIFLWFRRKRMLCFGGDGPLSSKTALLPIFFLSFQWIFWKPSIIL